LLAQIYPIDLLAVDTVLCSAYCLHRSVCLFREPGVIHYVQDRDRTQRMTA